ncbi:16S rRNA (adenine1518-N6/adenine1519-N6)-dimethyltransferase [Desulfosarcina sp. BuS5]|uniref:16S rRNA (adenine(1518)-N(6)/adenine(1519)-N(6))- dimethyltransferase RsmA n=1 Tax=Desulfosarcina sp. BuS5 TaxID=933262 RepID=UPI00048428CB|nr:16S rRNA (adenine(1518)-N(6)/adenine(1519)-N(6))-dimethyltransferase RsmA [Desulfosarcina sp. BuS5]WDN89636.1 16S rRNA (adenine1518-N6/adenine1519-N6)-dimethyltransferase [Desulfosarcina sp. BuS5]
MTSPGTLLSAWNLRPQKKMGQNFLSDPSTAEMIIARSGIDSMDTLLEVGAGLGALTVPAARASKKVYAVEKDQRLIDLLKTELLVYNVSNTVLINSDILRLDLRKLVEGGTEKIIVIGNLPYNISSMLLVRLIENRDIISRAVLMFQKEMAKRIYAGPNCKDYSRLSVMVQYCADIKKIATVKAPLFFPKPKVDSEVIELTFKTEPQYKAYDEQLFFRVIKAAFSKRRKTLKNSLSGNILNIDAKKSFSLLNQAGIDPVRRAESLTAPEFVKLGNQYWTQLHTDKHR